MSPCQKNTRSHLATKNESTISITPLASTPLLAWVGVSFLFPARMGEKRRTELELAVKLANRSPTERRSPVWSCEANGMRATPEKNARTTRIILLDECLTTRSVLAPRLSQ